MAGMNVDYHYLDQNVIRSTQDEGKRVGIWFLNAKTGGTTLEDATVYDRVFGKTGAIVDYFYSDSPIEAMKARDLIQNT